MVGNEFGQYVGEGGFATRGSPADENILPLGNVVLQLCGQFGCQRSHFNEVFHLESMRVELSNRQSHTVNAARWNHGGNTAAIRQTRV